MTSDDTLFDNCIEESSVGLNFVPFFLSEALAMADAEVREACVSNPPASNTLCIYGEVAGTPDTLNRLNLYDEILSGMCTIAW